MSKPVYVTSLKQLDALVKQKKSVVVRGDKRHSPAAWVLNRPGSVLIRLFESNSLTVYDYTNSQPGKLQQYLLSNKNRFFTAIELASSTGVPLRRIQATIHQLRARGCPIVTKFAPPSHRPYARRLNHVASYGIREK